LIFEGVLWGKVYTDDPKVLSLFSSSFYIMWVYTIVDVIKCVGISILRGCGRPEITVYGNFLACILFGFPLAVLFVFEFQWGLVGLWSAMCVAWLTCSLLYFTVIYKTDWNEEVEKARGRTHEEER
jgi:MATE family multidrug resistance protein